MQQNSPIKEKILQYLEIKGISKYEFYKNSGITRGVLDKDSGISEDNIAKFIAYAPEVNLNWLILDRGKMEIKHNYSNGSIGDMIVSEPRASYGMKTDKNLKTQRVPLYDAEATAGVVELFKNDNGNKKPIDFISIPNLPKCDGAIYVTGDSMYPLLKSGDIIMYKQLNNSIESIFFGEMYLISIDIEGEEYVTVKWIHKSEKGEQFIKIVSQNTHHQPKDVHLSHVKALALIKASVRINSMS